MPRRRQAGVKPAIALVAAMSAYHGGIGNYHDVNIFGNDPMDDTVGFEKNLTVLAKANGQQLLRIGSPPRIFWADSEDSILIIDK